MKFIAHRGNVNGKCPERENNIEYILEAISQGFDVEIDLWFRNNKFYLGHDNLNNKITIKFLKKYSELLWCHAKDIITFNKLLKYDEINCFFHQNDRCTLTSKKQIWTHTNENILTERSIFLIFEKKINVKISKNIYGICSDNISFYRDNNE